MGEIGRPTKLTPEVLEIIEQATMRGCYAHVAARAAGISPRTFHQWMHLGETEEKRIDEGSDPDPNVAPFLHFSQTVNRARASARGMAEARVWETNPEKWLLTGPGRDRGSDEGWSTGVKLEHTGKDGGPIETRTETVESAREKLMRDIDRLAERAKAKDAE